MTAILGISAFYHDSAAALVVDGQIVAAAQEERFSRRKHDADFPAQAIQYCLQEAGLTPEKIDYVGFYDKPLLKFERLLETYLAYAPRGFRSFAKAVPLWLHQKLHLPRLIATGLQGRVGNRCIFAEHHQSHAASAFFPSPFQQAAVLTIDGVGEWATASVGWGRENRLAITHQMRFPHSLGLLYSAFTYYCGFKVNSGEYKLMGLAPYGQPKYVDLILEKLVDLKPDGSLRLALEYFDYCAGLTMTSPRFDRLFGGRPRRPHEPLTEREMDLAASIQCVTEEAMLRMARFAHQQTALDALCLAGGVALNCVGNGRLLREGPFRQIWIQPAAGDAGGALGVALLIWYQLLGNRREPDACDSQCGSWLGPRYSTEYIRAMLDAQRAVYSHFFRRTVAVPPCRRIAGRRESCGLVSRTDGVRAAGTGQPQHPGRSAPSAHAKPAESQDQVPRVVPPIRTGRVARAGQRVFSAAPGRRKPVYASGRTAGRAVAPAVRHRRRCCPGQRAARPARQPDGFSQGVSARNGAGIRMPGADCPFGGLIIGLSTLGSGLLGVSTTASG